MHIWSDYVYLEIVDPDTGEPVPDGEPGEIVLTTLQKEGAPLVRFRTHDLSRIVPGPCECGSTHPRDRKSTRLNSSHSSISYAVFCLKKKNVVRPVFWSCSTDL